MYKMVSYPLDPAVEEGAWRYKAEDSVFKTMADEGRLGPVPEFWLA